MQVTPATEKAQMAKKEYAFYPGCSSQSRRSAANYLTSVNAMCDKLDVTLTEIPDWNCCGASIGYAEGGELPRLALSARNFALAETHMPGKEMVATCAACWLAQREVKERSTTARSCSRKPTRRWPLPACNTRAPRRSATWSRC
jgi:heterodisulfide reductase subunit B